MNKIMITIIAAIVLAVPMITAEEKNTKAPDFSLKNYDGKEYKLSDLQGKIVVLEWLNYECPFVKYHYEKASTMKDLAAKYKVKNVVWLAINSTAHLETAKNKAFAEKNNIPYPILDDHNGTTGRAYNATNTPHIFIIDPDGNIAYKGSVDNAPMGKVTGGGDYISYVDKALEELTTGKEVTTKSTKPYGCTVKYKN